MGPQSTPHLIEAKQSQFYQIRTRTLYLRSKWRDEVAGNEEGRHVKEVNENLVPKATFYCHFILHLYLFTSLTVWT